MEIRNILDNLKISELNAMQQAAVDVCSKGNDMILLSPTGSGKTLAYLIPLLKRLNREWKACRRWC